MTKVVTLIELFAVLNDSLLDVIKVFKRVSWGHHHTGCRRLLIKFVRGRGSVFDDGSLRLVGNRKNDQIMGKKQ